MDELIKRYFRLGHTHLEIVATLEVKHNSSISIRQLQRALSRLGLYRHKNQTDLDHVRRIISTELQTSGQLHGYRWMHLKLIQRGVVISKENVRRILLELDPEGVLLRKRRRLARRRYCGRGPNFIWHLDCMDKLKPFGIGISGCIDGFSRKIIWLEANSNTSDPQHIGGFYLEAVQKIGGSPIVVRADRGTENGHVGCFQTFLREHDDVLSGDKSFMVGRSTANQRIEAWWGQLRKQCTEFWLTLFHFLAEEGHFCGDLLDKELIRFIFLKFVQVGVPTRAPCSQIMIYLDYNATTPLDPEVLDSINAALKDAWGNPSSAHDAGIKAKRIIDEARRNVADMIGAKPSDIIFTSGGTEANNMILHSAIKSYWAEKSDVMKTTIDLPHVITSNLEHDSIKLVLQHFQEEGMAEVSFVPASKLSGRVEVTDVMSAIRPNTCLITVMSANNETGIIQLIQKICQQVKSLKRNRGETKRILIHTDAAQSIGKVRVDVDDLGVDYLTVVGHKFYGPRIGAVYARDPEEATPLYPLVFGGGQERGFRSGTENTAMIAGLGEAAKLVTKNIEKYEFNMRRVRDYLEEQLQIQFGSRVCINGRLAGSLRLPNTCNVSILGDGLQGYRVLSRSKKIQASVRAACHEHTSVSPVLLAIGIPDSIAENAMRLSIGRYNTEDEMDVVIQDLQQTVNAIVLENTTA